MPTHPKEHTDPETPTNHIETPPDLTEAEEEALDAIWDQINDEASTPPDESPQDE